MVCILFARITVLTIFCLFLPLILRCEQSVPWMFGVSGGAGVQFHSSGPNLPLPPAASPFTATGGPVLFLGLKADRLVLPWLYAGIEFGMQAWNGKFSAEEPSFFIIGGVGTPGVITHSLDLSMTSFCITPALTIPIASSFSANAGVQFNYSISNSYTQSQAVTEPASLPFVYGDRRIRGEIDNLRNLTFSLTAALRYSIPLGSSFVIEPEVRGYYGLSELMPNVDWSSTGVQGGIALVYAPVVQPPIVLRDTIYSRDTVQILVKGIGQERLTLTSSKNTEVRQERDDVVLFIVDIAESYLREIPKPQALLAAAVDVRFVQKDGRETESTTLMVEGNMKRHYLPLLPYIFFDEEVAVLPDKYRTERAKPQAGDAMLDMYYHVLDTVAARMNSRPRARITLSGVYSEGEQNGEQLARRRAEAVKEYMVNTWSIAPGRIRTTRRSVPQEAGGYSSETVEENRRVELASDDEHILASVVISDIDIIADPPLVRFYPDVVSEAGAASWQLAISLEGVPIREFSGGGSPPPMIEWDIASTPAAARLLAGNILPIQYEFSATDAEGTVARSGEGAIRFQQAQGVADSSFIHHTTDRFSLILFDFNTADLSPENREVVRLVRSVVAPHDSLSVLGFSDATGDEAYNQKLSQRRADAIFSLLKMSRSRVVGMGIDADLPHYLPEGRFYSRRVDVIREK